MTLVQHIGLTAVVSLIMLPFWNWIQIVWFSIGSVLIDIDHYIYFVLRRKRFGIREMFKYHDRLFAQKDKIPYAGICIFHTVDFFILIGILSLYYHVFFYLLIGLLFHFLVDFIHLYKNNYLYGRAYFFIEHLIRRRRHSGYPYF
jgi:type IV secretory pathway VirB3-like protein